MVVKYNFIVYNSDTINIHLCNEIIIVIDCSIGYWNSPRHVFLQF